MPPPKRSPEEIRASIESHRIELERSLGKLHSELQAASDWRAHIEHHKREVLIGAAIAGFVIGGGIAAIGGLFRRG
jgi:hypothetical protein